MVAQIIRSLTRKTEQVEHQQSNLINHAHIKEALMPESQCCEKLTLIVRHFKHLIRLMSQYTPSEDELKMATTFRDEIHGLFSHK